MNRKRILITGGTGFIGYHLAQKCLKLNWSVSSVSSKKPIKTRTLKNVRYLICDITNKKKLKRILSFNYDYVVNLAGYVDHSNKRKTLKSHFHGCKNLSTLFLNSKIKKFIQIGSSIEYGKIKSPQYEIQSTKKKINSIYGQAKLSSTNFLLDLNKKFNFPVIILRLYLIYGPYQEPNRVIPYTILNSLKKKSFSCSNGKQFRDLLFIDDLISAIISALKTDNVSGEIINVGYGNPKNIKKIILQICKIIGFGKPEFGKVKIRKDEIKSLYPNISKVKKLLKWKPKTTLNKGLAKTIKYFRNEIKQ